MSYSWESGRKALQNAETEMMDKDIENANHILEMVSLSGHCYMQLNYWLSLLQPRVRLPPIFTSKITCMSQEQPDACGQAPNIYVSDFYMNGRIHVLSDRLICFAL
jgi:hypothetical protein